MRSAARAIAQGFPSTSPAAATVAQAISEVLPDGDKEKQLLHGLLNQRDKIDEAMAEERLF